MSEIDQVNLNTDTAAEAAVSNQNPLEKLYSELKSVLNEQLIKNSINIQIDPFIISYHNKLELHLDKFLQENLHKSLQMEKKEINDRLLEAARNAFASFLYHLTLQQKATRMASIEAESFLKYFLVSGNSSYHFHIDGNEYFVDMIEFIPDLVQDIKEDNPKISKYKKSMLQLSELLQKLQTELFKQNEAGAEKIIREIKSVIDNVLLSTEKPISAKDLMTIQRLQAELTTEQVNPEQLQSQQTLPSQEATKNRVSPVAVRNNPRVPNQQIPQKQQEQQSASNDLSGMQRSVLNQQKALPPQSTFVKQLKRLFK